MSKHVPYVPDWAQAETLPLLPKHSDERPNATRVAAFLGASRRNRDLRIEVLGILRRQSLNGPELSISMLGMVLAAIAILTTAVAAMSPLGVWAAWLVGIFWVVATYLFFRLAGAVHFRRLTCAVWLAAYEDALRSR